MDNYHKSILPNGLRVITIPMPAVESVTAMILVGAGSRYETQRTNGISHFLEHMTFKGTAKRPSAFAISSTIDGIGADFNASTGKEETLFYVKSAKEHLDLALDVISDMVLAPLIKEDEVEREKGVILEELNMYEDLPMRRAAEYFEQLLFPNSSLGWDIGGEKETVKGINREDFLDYRKKLYLPDNMVLVVAGGVSENEVVEMANRYLGGLSGKKGKSEFAETFKQEKPAMFLKTKKTDQTHLVLGVRGNPLGHKDRYIETILASILGGGMSSRLFIQVRERRGLAYYVRADADHFLDNGYFAAAAGVDTKRAEEAIPVILAEFKKLTNPSEIKKEELIKAKEYVKGRLILELEDSRSVAATYGSQEVLEGKIRTPREMIAEIEKVTAEDVARVASEFFVDERLNLSIIGPFENKEKFEKILKF